MEIVAEKVILNGEFFIKTEIEEISSFCILDSDGLTYKLKTETPYTTIEVRKSKAMQKAMRATLFVSPNGSTVIASPDLRAALELYRK